MKQVLFAGGLTLCLLSCANGGNGSENGDSTASQTTTVASDPRDTVDRGYGAGANGNAATDTNTTSGTGSSAATDTSHGGNH